METPLSLLSAKSYPPDASREPRENTVMEIAPCQTVPSNNPIPKPLERTEVLDDMWCKPPIIKPKITVRGQSCSLLLQVTLIHQTSKFGAGCRISKSVNQMCHVGVAYKAYTKPMMSILAQYHSAKTHDMMIDNIPENQTENTQFWFVSAQIPNALTSLGLM
ncbi:hypothetical protein RF11_03810 [Thelohanellus kitauei]|uniref:Uncharacterized protein n=1 Tax=Thelohanellus kitauei TaxID=669202 RepID=A0A0C2N4R5_THEKT|nr:hypothetical protein RF11_03810 [Thelohanellus kitauei]